MDVTNTSNQSPLIHLVGSMSDGTSEYIESMEAAGQQQLVNSSVLPVEARGLVSYAFDADGWPEFEALGFTKGEGVEGDELFVNATLPDGWTRQGSDHSMWSYIVDNRGVRRVAVFYKAAFYDRRAHMHLTRPGRELASDIIYSGNDQPAPPAVLPSQWQILTDGEKDDFRSYITEYLESAEKYPDIYDDLAPRARILADLAN